MSKFNQHPGRRLSGLLAFLCLLLAGIASAQIHVSTDGNDTTGDGSMLKPFATLERALAAPGNAEVWVTGGEYFLGTGVTIPNGRTVRGGYKLITFFDLSKRWVLDGEPTILLNLGVNGLPAILLENKASLEWVTIAGGFYSVELLPESRLFEVDFLGGQLASVYARVGQTDKPAVMERCRILGGSGGIRVDGNANLVVMDTLVENTLGRPLQVTSQGFVGILTSVFQKSQSDGIALFGTNTTLIENTVIRANYGNGIRVIQSVPIIRGCLIEKNQVGIELQRADGADVEHCTIVANRSSGIYVREAQPNFRSNIIAYNEQFGIYEDKPAPIIETNDDGTTYVITSPTHTGALALNLFWQNTPAQYFDEGDSENGVFDEEGDINFAVTNAIDPVDNRVESPVFINREAGNYRLTAASPAIDWSPETTAFSTDLDGNTRLIDVDDVGEVGTNAVDLGAYEYHPGLVRNFATLYGIRTNVIDPATPGAYLEQWDSPEWQYTDFPTYNTPNVQFRPGRLRFWVEVDKTFGSFFRKILDKDQPADKLLIVKPTVASNDNIGLSMTRFRINGPEALDVVVANYYLGTREYAPTPEGREYELVVDLRQGGYRDLTPQEKPTYSAGFSMDVVEWLNQPSHSPTDYTGLKIEEVDRELFDAQFTNLARTWTFASASEVDWVPEPASIFPDTTFNDARLRYSGTKQALELSMNQYNTFGTWKSPGVPIKAGARYKIDITVSTPQSLENAPWFRFRTSTTFFEVIDELIIQSFPSGQGAPTPQGKTYTLYGRMPEVLEPVYESDMIELVLYMDMFGLFTDRPPNVTLYLEDVTVWTSSVD